MGCSPIKVARELGSERRETVRSLSVVGVELSLIHIFMLGAIVGDIVGSRFEFANTHRTDFEFFADGCNYTDDIICTIAIADALLRGADFADTLQTWCRRYPHPKGCLLYTSRCV